MPKSKKKRNIFAQLSRLFQSGTPRRVKTIADTAVAVVDKSKSSGVLLLQKNASSTYNAITSNAYNMAERLSRYQDFEQMEFTPEICSALDLFADECWATDEKGRALHIYSDDKVVKQHLEELFYDVLNIEYNGRPWTRSLCKFGDTTLYLDVHPEHGVINTFPVPINEIEREENYDKDNPYAVRYRWSAAGMKYLEDWEVAHFRLLGNDAFLPYGTSVIDAARRIWRQLILIEDAMLVYRIVRAPERRVFYIDVGNIPPQDVPHYVEEQKKALNLSMVMDQTSGKADVRYNPMSVLEDYVIPTRGADSGTRIDTLAGAQNATATDDVTYIQNKLFSALKVPKAYLGYEESLGSKSSLSQIDIRFARTINTIQQTMISELNKIALIHLFTLGLSEDQITNFTLRLSSPSTIAQQQKLELWRTKFDIANNAPENIVSVDFVRKNILDLTTDQIDEIEEQREIEVERNASLEAAAGGGGGGGALGGDLGGDLGDLGGDFDMPSDEGDLGGDDAGGLEDLEDIEADDSPEDQDDDLELIMSSDGPLTSPVKVSPAVQRAKYNASRRRGSMAGLTPDISKHTKVGKRPETLNDPYDTEELRALGRNVIPESKSRCRVSVEHRVMLSRMASSEKFMVKNPKSFGSTSGILTESAGVDIQDDIDSVTIDILPTMSAFVNIDVDED